MYDNRFYYLWNAVFNEKLTITKIAKKKTFCFLKENKKYIKCVLDLSKQLL